MPSPDAPPRSAAAGAPWLVARVAGYLLFAYGAVGVALQMRLPALTLAAGRALAGGSPFYGTPPDAPGTAALVAHFAGQPWAPWAAWLVALGLLTLAARATPALPPRPAGAPPGPGPVPLLPDRAARRRRILLGLAALLIVLVLGAYTRLNLLTPQSRGLTEAPYDDEGVYAGAGQMVLQGIVPYRDFFFAHPPLAALVYTPALAYHFTEWGSVTSFMIARYLSVAYSVAALAVLFALGWQVGAAGAQTGAARWRPLAYGATAAGLGAIDGRAIDINRKIMLDQPMILTSLLALLAYVVFLRRLAAPEGGAAQRWLLPAAGALAAVSGLTKIQGMATIVAIGLDLLLRVRRRETGAARPSDLVWLGAGFLSVTVVVVGPFLLLAGDPFVRMVGFFQLLRPSDGVTLPVERIANLTLNLRNAPAVYLAGAGFLALTWWAAAVAHGHGPAKERRALSLWRLVVIWGFLSVLLFTYSRSFYNHYYVQIAAPLWLLAGAVWLPLLRPDVAPSVRPTLAAYALALLPALILLGPAWQGFTTPTQDPIFALVARYVNDAVPPGTPVLATDEQFDFLASRPPSQAAGRYLIDSYGHMIFLGLGLGERSWGELLTDVARGAHSDDAYAVMRAPAPQADFLARARQAALIVIHERGATRLLPQTVTAIRALGPIREEQPRYVIVQPAAAR